MRRFSSRGIRFRKPSPSEMTYCPQCKEYTKSKKKGIQIFASPKSKKHYEFYCVKCEYKKPFGI